MSLVRGVVINGRFKRNYDFEPKSYYKNHIEGLLDYRKRRIPVGITVEKSLEAKDLIKYLVYWDKIEYPYNNLISIFDWNDEFNLLAEQGILSSRKIHFDFSDGDLGKLLLETQLAAFNDCCKIAGEQWTIAQEIDELYLPINKNEMEKVVEFNLINSLPVPIDTTPIYEILDFKERRKDELLKLRTHLDNIYTDIINAEEMQKEYQKRITEISTNLYDLNRLFREHRIKTQIDSLKSYFRNPKETINDILLPTAIVPLITSNMPTLMPYMPSINKQLALGACIAFVSKKMRMPSTRISPTEISPFAYTFQMGKEFQIR